MPEVRPAMICQRCKKWVSAAMNGVGITCCNGLRACQKCPDGIYQGKPTPNWMNRMECDKCGHEKSR
jgi:hypothetical protein